MLTFSRAKKEGEHPSVWSISLIQVLFKLLKQLNKPHNFSRAIP
jgi:hypothetical protein|tara:strand:+ start:77 stop:208 length:132 start_codon:yes stop_codon:yes gene_type:complete